MIYWQYIPSCIGKDKYALVRGNTIVAMTTSKLKGLWWRFKYPQYTTETRV